MSAVGIIPARFRASRFPGKPLATIAGRPMLAHVIEGARRAKKLREVIVATDDERIAAAAAAVGAPVAMTSPDHPTGTDRLAEAAAPLADAIVVNVQGDEPLIEGFVIDAAVEALEADAEAPMATVVHPLESDALADPNRVKAVLDRRGRALYFSRAPIPYRRADGPAPRWLQHVGLYAYRKPFLERFLALAPGEAERAEGLEQLRALEHGFAIRCAVIEGWRSVPVDVPADVAKVEAVLAGRAR
jgi:3-deoxy-manno-octulosonate cytidylyltransferase (CMP-KDO synthetase)